MRCERRRAKSLSLSLILSFSSSLSSSLELLTLKKKEREGDGRPLFRPPQTLFLWHSTLFESGPFVANVTSLVLLKDTERYVNTLRRALVRLRDLMSFLHSWCSVVTLNVVGDIFTALGSHG